MHHCIYSMHKSIIKRWFDVKVGTQYLLHYNAVKINHYSFTFRKNIGSAEPLAPQATTVQGPSNRESTTKPRSHL